MFSDRRSNILFGYSHFVFMKSLRLVNTKRTNLVSETIDLISSEYSGLITDHCETNDLTSHFWRVTNQGFRTAWLSCLLDNCPSKTTDYLSSRITAVLVEI